MTLTSPNNGVSNIAPNEQAWQLHRNAEGRLVLSRANGEADKQDTPIQIVACFPWSHPQQYISLRDDKGHELYLIESLDELETQRRQLVEEELALRNFLPRVTVIHAITDQMEFFHWSVTTSAGQRSFLTRRHERPRQLRNGQMLIKDICNDIYAIARSEDMDPKSLRLLWVYMD